MAMKLGIYFFLVHSRSTLCSETLACSTLMWVKKEKKLFFSKLFTKKIFSKASQKMKKADVEDCLKTYRWTRSYLDNTNGRERLHDYVHYVAKVRSLIQPNPLN